VENSCNEVIMPAETQQEIGRERHQHLVASRTSKLGFQPSPKPPRRGRFKVNLTLAAMERQTGKSHKLPCRGWEPTFPPGTRLRDDTPIWKTIDRWWEALPVARRIGRGG
jgi:hypothetical protein